MADRRELLLRKRELLLKKAQSRKEQAPKGTLLEKTGEVIQQQFPELVHEQGLVPPALSGIGRQLEQLAPQALKPGFQIAAETAKSLGRAARGGIWK